MKLSYTWLKELVGFKESPQDIAHVLTFQVSEATIASTQPQWDGIISAHVAEVHKHPNADKLSVCNVTDGTQNYTIVCGAANVAPGQKVALALIGATLPGDFKIERRKIRGVESEGMLCSEKELGLEEKSAGILVLADNVPIGVPLKKILTTADTLIELETNSNRPDCLSHIGVAREIAAHLQKKIKYPKITSRKLPKNVPIAIKEKGLCHRYIGQRITGVKVGPSPDWITKRLDRCGIRSINNIVDITNYVLLEMGHPLHAFDLKTIEGGELVVRCAKKDERITALDGKVYTLNDTMLVIADTVKPQAIAGIIGGEHSGVTEMTTDIILESAVFLQSSVRKTAKSLNLSTESSYRFERGCSWEIAELAAKRAADLIEEIAGGTIEAYNDVIAKPFKRAKIELNPERVNQLLGTTIHKDKMQNILSALELKVTGKTVDVPSWRLDITQDADLIEEIARINGYDKIPLSVLTSTPTISEDRRHSRPEHILRTRLVSLGFCETMNNSLTNHALLKRYSIEATEEIINPMSKENETVRPNLLPGLMENLQLNISQGYKSIKLFETGKVFLNTAEKNTLAILAYGNIIPDWWKLEDNKISFPEIDVSYILGILKYIFEGQVKTITNTNASLRSHYFHPAKWAEIRVNDITIGQCGAIHPTLASELGKEVAYAEIDLDALQWNYTAPVFKPLKRFPRVKRDLAFVSDKAVTFDNIEAQITQLRKSSQNFNDVFEGLRMFSRYPLDNNISYALHFTFQSADHTLTDTEVTAIINLILDTFKKTLNISLRS